ncbi:unnamed protein product [Aphanomyces euteiches]
MSETTNSPPVIDAVPPKRRGFTTTLLWKNFLIKRKHPIKWALEILIPLVLLVLLGYLKSLRDDEIIPEGWSNGAGSTESLYMKATNVGNPRVYQTEVTVSGLLLKMATDPWDSRKEDLYMTEEERKQLAIRVPSMCRGYIVPRKLAIVPDNDFTRKYFLQTLSEWYSRVPLNANQTLVVPSIADSVKFFADEASLEAYITGSNYGKSFTSPTIAAAIVFTTTPPTLGSVGNIETEEFHMYAKAGFMAYQTLVTRFALCVPDWNTLTKTTTANCTNPKSIMTSGLEAQVALAAAQLDSDPNMENQIYSYTAATKGTFNLTLVSNASLVTLARPLRQMPQPIGGAAVFAMPIRSFTTSPVLDTLSSTLSIIVLLSYLHILSSVLVALISEKETKARELLKILGVHEFAIVRSWYITYGILFILAAILQMVVCKLMLFQRSSSGILFAFFLLFGWNVMTYGYMVSAIFSKARSGAYLGMIGFFAMLLVSYAFSDTSSATSKHTACIFGPVAMAFGVKTLAKAEGNGVGLTTSNWADDINNFKFITTLYMLIIDSILYTLLGMYLERVIPKDYGVTEKWYFPLLPSYWRTKSAKATPMIQHETSVEVEIHNDNFEPVGADLKQQERIGEAFQINNLRRVFPVPGGEKVAVKGMNLTMYKNQITCLLGHNGAGKTTLISMLTGMIPVTSGDATINGLSLSKNLSQIRQSLGMYPQHDVLYPELTVQEHLMFYGKIKGYSGEALKTEVDNKIVEVGLTEKRNVYSNELSGGMKRKLSLAIALLGDSKIVFLDEPTSGMDPYSRRSSWEIIMNNRPNRIVVLTTHFMDEADILGDRIAIMAEGELRCCGSSLFLKNRYGAGYNFSLVKAEHCNTSALVDFVQGHIGESTKVLSNVGTEISFQLPLDCSHLFAKMFAELDDKLDDLGVLSYGISVTTLEEVFIKVAEIGDEHHQHTLQTQQKKELKMNIDGSRSECKLTDIAPKTELAMFFIHFMALFMKRMRTAKRDKRLVFFGTILPVVFLVLGVALLKGSSNNRSDPPISLTTDSFPYKTNTPVPYLCESDWMCDAVNQITQAKPQPLTGINSPVYSSPNPVVFGIQYNLTGTNVQSYDLKAAEEIFKRGYGKDTSPISGQMGGYVFFGDAKERTFGYNLIVNTTAIHSAIVHKAMMDEALYRTMTSNNNVKLTCTNAPLPLTNSNQLSLTTSVSYTTGVFVVIAFVFFTASIVPYLVHEKHPSHNSKHQQLVSGVSLSAFGSPTSPLTCCCTPFHASLACHNSLTCPSTPFAAVVVVFFLFGFAIISFCYILSYLFVDAPSSQTYIIMINLVCSTILNAVSSFLDTIYTIQDINKKLKFLWRLSPLFCVGNSLNALSSSTSDMADGTVQMDTSAFSTDVVGMEIFYLAVEEVVFPLIAIGIDYALSFPTIKATVSRNPQVVDEPYEVDDDVKAEMQRVASGAADKDAVVMKNLRKVYKGGKVGVVDLSLALPKGECFGYLGIK